MNIITKASFPKWQGPTPEFGDKDSLTFYGNWERTKAYREEKEARAEVGEVLEYTVNRKLEVTAFWNKSCLRRFLKSKPDFT